MALNTETITDYTTVRGVHYEKVDISYQQMGKSPLGAPTLVIIHALTGNSDVANPQNGWWKDLFYKHNLFDLDKYHIISFNIPGNGYDDFFIDQYEDWIAKDVGILFNQVLSQLQIENIYAVIGGSLGGGIAWEMALLAPDKFKYIIPIATNWKASDWVIAHNHIQENILQNSKNPIQDARKMAMMFYRSPSSFTQKFNLKRNENDFEVISWLNHHGQKLKNRFSLLSYLLMNHLMSTIGIQQGPETLKTLSNHDIQIIQVAIDTDMLFSAYEMSQTKQVLDDLRITNHYFEIQSPHGHDAFLIEFDQIASFLKPFFN